VVNNNDDKVIMIITITSYTMTIMMSAAAKHNLEMGLGQQCMMVKSSPK